MKEQDKSIILLKIFLTYLIKKIGLSNSFNNEKQIKVFLWRMAYLLSNLSNIFLLIMTFVAFHIKIETYVNWIINLILFIFITMFWLGNLMKSYPKIIYIRIFSDCLIIILQLVLFFLENAMSAVFIFGIFWFFTFIYHKKLYNLYYEPLLPQQKIRT